DTPTDPNPAYTFAKSVSDASGDGKAQSGEVLTYTITVTNTGDVDYNAIVIHDKIPAHTTFFDASATGGAVPNSEGELEWVVDVPFGGLVSVGFQVTVADNLTGTDKIENIATVGGEDTPPVDTPTDPNPAYTFAKSVSDASGDGKAQSGEVLTYTITVTNTGDVDLAGIPVVDL